MAEMSTHRLQAGFSLEHLSYTRTLARDREEGEFHGDERYRTRGGTVSAAVDFDVAVSHASLGRDVKFTFCLRQRLQAVS